MVSVSPEDRTRKQVVALEQKIWRFLRLCGLSDVWYDTVYDFHQKAAAQAVDDALTLTGEILEAAARAMFEAQMYQGYTKDTRDLMYVFERKRCFIQARAALLAAGFKEKP